MSPVFRFLTAIAVALAGAACSGDVHALASASASPLATEQEKGGSLEVCQMHVDYDEQQQLFHAVYDNEHCGAGSPRWVAIDYWVDQVDLEVMSSPDVKGTPCTPELCYVGAARRSRFSGCAIRIENTRVFDDAPNWR